MRTALDAPIDALDDPERRFVGNVRDHGWAATHVFADHEGPGFTFSTGFWVKTGQPELILFGMKQDITHDILWDLYRDAAAGKALPIAAANDQAFANLPAYAFPVAKRFYPDYLGWGRWFYAGDDFPCLHVVWPDRAGVFPWEAGFDPHFVGLQPDLTEHGWSTALGKRDSGSSPG
ncbi:MAG: DUF4262 domain-containing protein [Sphingomonas paucimobilis]